jgi:hypothetical protein
MAGVREPATAVADNDPASLCGCVPSLPPPEAKGGAAAREGEVNAESVATPAGFEKSLTSLTPVGMWLIPVL